MSCEKFQEWVKYVINEISSKRMKNPCENCLIRSVCIIPCVELNKFAHKVSVDEDTFLWLNEFELRPRIICLSQNSCELICLYNGGIDELV